MNDINYKLTAERLWSILDDIDTAFDHYKPDMKDRFVNYVYEKCRERGLYANSKDGQTLTFVKEIPVINGADPMCRWFRDAWTIEKKNNICSEQVDLELIKDTEPIDDDDDDDDFLYGPPRGRYAGQPGCTCPSGCDGDCGMCDLCGCHC